MGIFPSFNALTLASSRSRQKTSLPMSARQAPVTRPTYPVPTTVTFMSSSRCEVELFAAPRRVGLPAAARRAQPVELARLETAVLAAIAGEPARVTVHEISYQLEVVAPLGAGRADDLRLQQPVEAEQRGIAPQ